MGKVKQQAAARADELLKSYDVKLNPIAGTYRLVDKATGKETNVERSGVDVGTSWLASGRRANKLIGKNLVKQGTSVTASTPVDTSSKSKDTKTTNTTVASGKPIPTAKVNGTPLMLNGLPSEQPAYEWALPNIASVWNKRGNTTGNTTVGTAGTTPVQQVTNNVIPGASTALVPKSSYRPLDEYPEGFEIPDLRRYRDVADNTGPIFTPMTKASGPLNNDKNLLPELENYLEFKTRRNPYPSREARDAHKKQLGITTQSPEFVAWLNKKQESQAMPSLSIY